MKYLSETMTAAEAKKAYRALAKQLHPDHGGDEEEFKILADEYSEIEKRVSADTIASIDDMMEATGAMVTVIANTLAELYPRTRVVLNYTTAAIDAEITGNVPMHRMLHIEQVIRSFRYPLNVTLYFKRDPIKKWISLRTSDDITFINVEPGITVTMESVVPLYSGKRYAVYRTQRFERCVDKRTGHQYYMRRLPKLQLKELLGIRGGSANEG